MNHGNRDYKPDPKSRSAFELASHIAVADNWFLQSVLDGKFEFDQEAATKAESQFKNADEIAAFYQKTVPDKLKQLRAMPAEKLAQEIDFFGFMKAPLVTFLTMTQNHSVHHRGQLAAYLRAMGSARAFDLRRQRRRADAGGLRVVVSRSPHIHRAPPPRRRHRHGGGAGRSPSRSRRNSSTRDCRGWSRA